MYSSKIKKALAAAIECHKDQKRKGEDNIPYVTHPIAVAIEMSRFTGVENLICAGILHDTLEDTEYTAEQMEKDFGEEVLTLVQMVSEDKSIQDYETRKQKAIEKASQHEVGLLIKSIDAMVNMTDLRDAISEQGDKTWDKFKGTPKQRIGYFKKILELAHPHMPSKMVMDYTSNLKDLEHVCG